MFPGLNFVDYVIILFGVLLCFKRVAEMERYHDLRVVILTAIVGAFVVFFLLAFAVALDEPLPYDCQCADQFTLSEI